MVTFYNTMCIHVNVIYIPIIILMSLVFSVKLFSFYFSGESDIVVAVPDPVQLMDLAPAPIPGSYHAVKQQCKE